MGRSSSTSSTFSASALPPSPPLSLIHISNLDEAAFTDVATGTLVNSGFLNGRFAAELYGEGEITLAHAAVQALETPVSYTHLPACPTK